MPPVSFENTLQRACTELESLAELLTTEQAEIATATQARIEELTQEKRRRLESLQMVLASASPSTTPGQDMSKIKALAERARQAGAKASMLNRINGQMISMRARVTDARLDALASAAGCPRTYGADGGLRMARNSRPSITA